MACLDSVPLDGLHLTMPKLAWADQISGDDVERAVAAAAEVCAAVPPFALQVGPLAGSPGAVRFSVGPWEPLIEVYRGLTQNEDEFRPHVGVAYCNTAVPAGPVRRMVEALRALPPVAVWTASVELVALRREEHAYRWDVHATMPLGGIGL